jgi:hypothetical protein
MAPNLSHGWTFIMKTTSEVVSEVGIPRQKLYYLEQKAFVIAFTQIGKWRRFVPSGNTFGKASDTVQHMKEHWRN